MRKKASALLGAVVVLLVVTVVSFGLSYLSPTDAAVESFTTMGIAPTDEQLAAKRAELGLDQPFFIQYLNWLGSVLTGDLGTSYRNGVPVAETLAQALPYTIALATSTMLVTLAISIPLGLMCAKNQGRAIDRVMSFFTYLFNSLPSFFVALMLLYICSVQLGIASVMSARDLSGILLPTLALALPLSGWFTRQVRSYALGQLGSTYVDGLRSRGISERRILWVHVLRNIALPLLTLAGTSFGMLLGGSAIVESIFNWPGLGFTSIQAIGHRDYPFIGAYALCMALMYLVVNGAIDASYKIIDRRLAAGHHPKKGKEANHA